jgi:hemoglobin-like flavoprotein
MHRGRTAPAPIDLELIRRLKQSFDRILSAGERLPELTFSLLFQRSPGLRKLFPEEMKQVKHQFAHMLAWLVAHLHEPQKLRIALVDLGRRHHGYSVLPEHYPILCDVLIEVFSAISADDWNEELARDWRQTFELMVDHMLRAYPAER